MIIETQDLSKSFGKVRALDELDLRVGKGVTGLVGPNGSGKTTAIKISLGLLKTDEGSVKVFDFDPWTDGYEVRRRIGVLHEKPSFPRDLTGSAFLKYVAKFHGIAEWEKRVHETLKSVGLDHAGHRPIKTYSAGMVQRLGLAQAVIGAAEFVILDEPTANLDPMGRVEVLELVASLSKDRGMSFLISTHILPELERVCEKIFVMYMGRIMAEGTLSELMEKYNPTDYTIRLTKSGLLAEKLNGLDSVEEVDLDEKGGRVHVKTKDPHALKNALFKLALELDLHIISIEPRHGLLEQIYRRILGG
ncbi:MAG: ABC transporter ATP-binding protein [Thermoproteota archaeon]